MYKNKEKEQEKNNKSKKPETIEEFIQYVKGMISRLSSTDFHEAELSTESWSVRFVKDSTAKEVDPVEEEKGFEVSVIEFPDDANKTQRKVKETGKILPVTSHLVGIFWSSPSRNGTVKVSPGDAVKEGQVLGGIEAVNLMHPIQSPHAGRILEVLINEGDPVEYGQYLFLLEINKESSSVNNSN